MEQQNHKIKLDIPDSTLKSIKDAQESYRRIAGNLANIMPKIPKFDLPKIPELPQDREPMEMISPEAIREQNAWERHKEVIDVQNALVGVQSKILDEQKSNARLTKIVVGLSTATVIISIISLIS